MVVIEQQSFRGTVLMYGIIMLELPTLLLISLLYFNGKLGDGGWIAFATVGTLIPLTFILMMSLVLETRIDPYSFSYRNFPFQTNWKKIRKEDISSISIQKKDGFPDYGGIGLRFYGKTKAYIYFADHVIEIESGAKKLVLTTKKPKEFEAVIDLWRAEKLVN
ncbi:hypothetical protein D0X99_13980 [Algoriphagus lacus]|uniref:Bacterial Pleckstrin homology domain-containing protein n=1 Tax=Algoriphagus lacus TaxID=2056311 RepID=A0A418PPB9_9BACT|nr:hypothetical protein [Algoriphagus lacus]RIW13929.1 hypothetical protein D0X99_13980 [Algoriphagus lacus]